VYRIVAATVSSRQAYFLRTFSERGYRWAFGSDEASVADEVIRSSTDLLLVDAVALGDLSSQIVASVKRISGLRDLPILAVIQEDDIRRFPEAFWDDFVLDPMRQGELALRIGLVLARKRGGTTEQVNIGPVTIDYDRYEVTRHGQRMSLTYKEHELLRFLASNPSKAFTREAILDRVWGGDYIGGVRTVDVHVRRLRAKLGDHRGKTIETVRGVGYRFRKSND
jgi:DNA-binding response OmpR family regulator